MPRTKTKKDADSGDKTSGRKPSSKHSVKRNAPLDDDDSVDSKGNIQLEGGTRIPAGSYIDAAGKLRSPDGGLINIGRRDILQATSSPSPAPSAPSPAPTPPWQGVQKTW